MRDHSTLSDYDIERIVNSPAMADQLKKFIDEKFGEQQHELETIGAKVDGMSGKIDSMQSGINNLASRVDSFMARQDTLSRKSEDRIARTLDEKFAELTAQLRSDLGINTDTRKRDLRIVD